MSDRPSEVDPDTGRERPDQVDQPEPDQVLAATTGRTLDHEPTDGDDREVLLDDPASPEPPFDDAEEQPEP